MPGRQRAAPNPLSMIPLQAPGSEQCDAMRREALRELMSIPVLAKAPDP